MTEVTKTEKTEWSFDDTAIGETIDGNTTLHSRVIARPEGMERHLWYSHASSVCGALATTRAELAAMRSQRDSAHNANQAMADALAAKDVEIARLREALEAASDRLLRAARIMSDEFLTMTAEQFLGYSDEARDTSTGASA